jgi:hypothetical protein
MIPILILKRQNRDANTTTVSVDVNYVHSFCSHLNENKIAFTKSDFAEKETGCNRDKEWWDFIANEVVIQNVTDFPRLLGSRNIPATLPI